MVELLTGIAWQKTNSDWLNNMLDGYHISVLRYSDVTTYMAYDRVLLKFHKDEDYTAFVLRYGTEITYRTLGLIGNI